MDRVGSLSLAHNYLHSRILFSHLPSPKILSALLGHVLKTQMLAG